MISSSLNRRDFPAAGAASLTVSQSTLVADARKRGSTPVLVTPVNRRTFKDDTVTGFKVPASPLRTSTP